MSGVFASLEPVQPPPPPTLQHPTHPPNQPPWPWPHQSEHASQLQQQPPNPHNQPPSQHPVEEYPRQAYAQLRQSSQHPPPPNQPLWQQLEHPPYPMSPTRGVSPITQRHPLEEQYPRHAQPSFVPLRYSPVQPNQYLATNQHSILPPPFPSHSYTAQR